MAERILFPEWRDSNRDVRYPFADTATLVTRNGFRLPPELFLDGCLYPVGAQAGLYVTAVVVAGQNVTLRVGDAQESNRAEATFSVLEAPEVLAFRDRYGRPAGILVADPAALPLLASWGDGTHAFFPEATPLAASALIPLPDPGLQGIVVEGELLTGDLWLVGGTGIALRWDGDAIRIDAVGDPLFQRRSCGGAEFPTPRFLRTLNGLPPGDAGGITITTGSRLAGDTILRIYSAADGLHFEAVGQKLEGVR